LLLSNTRDYPTIDFDVVIDIRSTLTVAALNLGIVSLADMLEVTDKLYFFTTDDSLPLSVFYDPKFPSMMPIYMDTSGVVLQRVGNTGLVPSFNAMFYSETKYFGTEVNEYHYCPASCESASALCSTPAFSIEFGSPTTGDIADLLAAIGAAHVEFGFIAYTDELYVLNDAKMDPGRIACKASQSGSFGKLGNLNPVTSQQFLVGIQSTQPFKLAESYYYCFPDKLMAFFTSFGVAQGNTSMLFTFLLMTIIVALSALRCLNVTVTEVELDSTMLKLAEIIKISRGGGELREEHKEILTILSQALDTVVVAHGAEQHQSSIADIGVNSTAKDRKKDEEEVMPHSTGVES
jgi:hypothetical protein